MNLAERIKNEIRMSNEVDYKGLSDMFSELFKLNPMAPIRLKDDVDNRFRRDGRNVYMPKEWFANVETWAKGNGFKLLPRRHSCTNEIMYIDVILI